MQRDVFDVMPVDGDAPLPHVVKAGQKVDDRRLARARGADEGDLFAGADVEIEVFEDGDARLVAEGDVVEVHPSLDVVQDGGVLFIGDRDGGIDGLVDAFEIRRDLRELLQDGGDLQKRLRAQPHVEEEGDDGACDRGIARRHQGKGDGVEGERARVPEKFRDGRVELVAAHDLHPRPEAVFLQVVVDLPVVVGAVVVLDDLLAHDGFDDEGVAVAVLGAVGAEELPHRRFDEQDAHGERDERRVDDGRQKRADAQHEHGADDDLEDADDGIEEIGREEVGELVDVFGDADGDLAGGAGVVVLEGELLQVREDLAAKIGDDAVPHRPHDGAVEIGKERR